MSQISPLFGEQFKAGRIETAGAHINFIHGGSGEPLLLLHGYPQSHVMWHAVAPALVQQFHLICADLRGYGDSIAKMELPDHAAYSKRAMAQDMVEVMQSLGHDRFYVAGHDRGARVAHRLAIDHPRRVRKLCIMDIAPTYYMFAHTDQTFATGYYHWFFLIQPDGLPEHMIGTDPSYFLQQKLRRWSAPGAQFNSAAVDAYKKSFARPEVIHASCEDYRAAASIDLQHDKADLYRKLPQPLLVLWGKQGFINRRYDVLNVWRERAEDVRGEALDCGHFLPEERPIEVIDQLQRFFI
ncbi:MAG: alpha/beta hydrolase [Gammaproteobacteria bacterium]